MLCDLIVRLASCHLYGAHNLGVARRFLENFSTRSLSAINRLIFVVETQCGRNELMSSMLRPFLCKGKGSPFTGCTALRAGRGIAVPSLRPRH